jgi:hypothetical protein
MTAAALGLERSETHSPLFGVFPRAFLRLRFDLTAPAGNKVVDQNDYGDHDQDVNQVATEVADESE